jgi:hypothetical protein
MTGLVDDPNDSRWQEAERRDQFLRELLKETGWKATRDVVDAARMTFGVSRSTVYRIISRFLATRRASSLVPADRGTPRGAKRSLLERVRFSVSIETQIDIQSQMKPKKRTGYPSVSL